MVDEVLLFFIAFFEFYILNSFVENRFEKSSFHLNTVLYCILFSIAELFINCFDNSILNCVGYLFLFVSFIALRYKTQPKQILFYAVVFLAITVSLEFISEWIFILVDKTCATNYIELLDTDYFLSRWYFILIEKMFLFVLIKIINYKTKAFLYINSLFYGFFILPCATIVNFFIVFIYTMKSDSSNGISIILAIAGFMLLFSNVFVFYLIEEYSRLYYNDIETGKNKIKASLEKKHYEILNEINLSNEQFIHDISKYLRAINALACKNNCKDISDIIAQIYGKCNDISKKHYCNVPIVNAVINEKTNDAEKNNIKFKVDVSDDFDLFSISEIDFISGLGNILDNAFDAAVESIDKLVDISLYVSNNSFLVIDVRNSYKEKPIMVDNRYITRKKNRRKHGHGMMIVKNIAEKYEGMYNVSIDDNFFCVTLILPK